MADISLQDLLEAGSHFGHKAERWHPRAAQYIYTKKDGIHIIDLAKTKAGLEAAIEFIDKTVSTGGEVMFVGTKRQAKAVVKDEASRVGAPFFSHRWIGGFLTNWESVKKNIKKINNLAEDKEAGGWKRYPKHERFKLDRYLKRLGIQYAGVLKVTDLPAALFVIDVRREKAAVYEAQRKGIPVIGVVDTNADPRGIDYVIPANDDAVGSIAYITKVVADAYEAARGKHQKLVAKQEAEAAKQAEKEKKEAEKRLEQEKKDREKAAKERLAKKSAEKNLPAQAGAEEKKTNVAKKQKETKKASDKKPAAKK